MDTKLFDMVKKEIPSMNSSIVNGLAVKEMRFVEQYIDTLLRCAEEDFPEGLTYKEYQRITPIEEYIRATEPVGNKSTYDVARNDVYMILLIFEFKGERIIKPIYLPFVRDGGLISIHGSTFAVAPKLADKGVSLGPGSAFVQISKAKFTARRTIYTVVVNGRKQAPYISYSKIHNRSRATAKSTGSFINMETTLGHYLFAKYGVAETFRKYCNTNIAIGDETTINAENYPRDEWIICTSSKLKPKGVRGKVYNPSNVALAIRECDYDKVVESLVTSFFYVVDHFPERVQPEYLDGTVHEIQLWRVLLGHIVGGVTGGEGRIAEDMDEHMDSLDSYIDARTRSNLAQGDIHVHDVYDLLFYLIGVLTHVVIQTTDTLATMWDKQFMVLRYALKEINDSIFSTGFKLKKAQLKRELTYADVAKIIKRNMITDAVFKISDGNEHREVSSVSSPGDNKFFKITSNLSLQSASSESGGRSKGAGDKSKLLHSSIAEVGSYTVLPKSEPTGRGRVNPWVQIDGHNCVVRKEENVQILDKVQELISRSQ